MTNRIDTAAARRVLAPRRDPYWTRIELGAALGYRVLAEGSGTWNARWRDHEGKQHFHSLGSQPDYDTAARLARQWFQQCAGGGTEVATVEEACRRYVEDRRVQKGEATATDAEGRLRRQVYGTKFGAIKLPRLSTTQITDWHRGLVKAALDGLDPEDDDLDEEYAELERRAKDSANRNLATLKAALNLAHAQGLASTTAAWDRVAKFAQVGRRRERFLTIGERQELLKHSTLELQRLIRAVLLTGARPGEIAAARVGDYDPVGLLTLQGKTGRRTIPVSPAAAQHFGECASDREPEELLVARDDGRAWTRAEWRDAVQEARIDAGLDKIVMYHLRHAAISEMIVSGIDLLTVARLTGTSIEMIQRSYGHLVDNGLRDKLAAVPML